MRTCTAAATVPAYERGTTGTVPNHQFVQGGGDSWIQVGSRALIAFDCI